TTATFWFHRQQGLSGGGDERGSLPRGGLFSVGHRRYVQRGRICACAASGSCRGQEPASGSPEFWAGAEDGRQDPGVFIAARLSAAEAYTTTEAGPLARCHRCHSGAR